MNCIFEPKNTNSSATICKWCGLEKSKHNQINMENTPKQTAVEWLYAKLETLRGELNYDVIDYEMYKIEKTRIYREALHREKQQNNKTYEKTTNN